MRAIQTRYYGPTNFKPSKIGVKVGTNSKSVFVSWNYDLGVEENHRAAAEKVAGDKGFTGTMYGACVDGGMVFVMVC